VPSQSKSITVGKFDLVLNIMSSGDRSVGIDPGRYTVIFHGTANSFDAVQREDTRDLLKETFETFDEFPCDAWFDDECSACKSLLSKGECLNGLCIASAHEEEC
jgi:hypothetical protein